MKTVTNDDRNRRGFLQRLMALGGLSAAAPAAGLAQAGRTAGASILPDYVRGQDYKSLKQSSYDRTGGNADRWPIQPGATQELFNAEGPGVISHIWFTISAQSANHLKELVLRIYWDGNARPSVETPIGDFFGLNLGQYVDLRVGLPGLLAGPLTELLLRHALSQVRAHDGHK